MSKVLLLIYLEIGICVLTFCIYLAPQSIIILMFIGKVASQVPFQTCWARTCILPWSSWFVCTWKFEKWRLAQYCFLLGAHFSIVPMLSVAASPNTLPSALNFLFRGDLSSHSKISPFLSSTIMFSLPYLDTAHKCKREKPEVCREVNETWGLLVALVP